MKRFLIHIIWRVAGEDPELLIKSRQTVQTRFIYSGLLVFFTFFYCLSTSYYTFNNLFNYKWLSLILAVSLSLIVLNLFRLNLITLTTNREAYTKEYFSSMFIRVSFIFFLSICIVKPFELMVFNKGIQKNFTQYIEEENKKAISGIESYYQERANAYSQEIVKYKTRTLHPDTNKINFYQGLISTLNASKAKYLSELILQQQTSSYFLARLRFLNNEYPIIWILSLAQAIFLIIPFIIKFSLSPSSIYLTEKGRRERNLIQNSYNNFLHLYSEIFKTKYGLTLDFHNKKYLDPPFNTKPIERSGNIFSQQDLIRTIYGE